MFNTGYVLSVEVANNGSTVANGWTANVQFNQDPQFTNGFNANYTTQGNTVIATPVAWNTTIQPGQTWSIGFQGNHNGNFVEPTCVATSP